MLRRALADERWTVFWYSLGLLLYGLLIVAFWPTMKKNTELLAQYIKSFPEVFLKAFGVSDFSHFVGFVGAEFLNFMWPLIASIFTVMAASASVAGEVDRGTAELWLSVPTPRWRLLAAKLVAIAGGVVVLVAVTLAGIVLGAAFVGESLEAASVLAAGVTLAALCVAVGGYGALFSSLLSERGKAAGLAAAVTLASYLASIIAGISADWDWLRYASLMTAYHPQQALEAGAVRGDEVAALLGIGLASSVLALLVFERRDVAP